MTMLILKSSTENIDAILAAAVTANQQHVFICYEDYNPASKARKWGSVATLTTDDTEVSVCAGPAVGWQRHIKHIAVFNDDTATSTITLRIDNGTTEPVLFKATLPTKESIYWSPEGGWKVLTVAGALRVTAHA